MFFSLSLTHTHTPGSWLLLDTIDQLLPAVLQTACTLLSQIKLAHHTQTPTIQYLSDSIHIKHDSPGACFATSITPSNVANLPHSLMEAFTTISITRPAEKPVLEALLIAAEFENASYLAKQLSTFSHAIDELFNQNTALFLQEGRTHTTERAVTFPLGLRHLRAVVSLAQRHMKEFEAVGNLLGHEETLHMPSTVYLEFSVSTRTSLKFRSIVMRDSQVSEAIRQPVPHSDMFA